MDSIYYVDTAVNPSTEEKCQEVCYPSPEQAAEAVGLIGKYCIMWSNVKNRRDTVGIHLSPLPSDPGTKRWISNCQFLNTPALINSILTRSKGYGISHKVYTDTLILDIDNPNLVPKVFAVLHQIGLQSTLTIESGRPGGLHLWIKFDSIPRHLIFEYGSAQLVIKTLGAIVKAKITATGGIDIRGDGGSVIAIPGSWSPFSKCYLWQPGCSSWDTFIEYLRTVPDRLNSGALITRIIPACTGEVPARSSTHTDGFHEWLAGQSVEQGETNDFTLDLVTAGFRSKISPDLILDAAMKFHSGDNFNGRSDGRDFESRLTNRINWRLKHAGSFDPLSTRTITAIELEFLQRACDGVTPLQLRFIALMYCCNIQAFGGVFYLSRNQALKFAGVSRGSFNCSLRKFADIVRVVTIGDNQPGRHTRRMASTYMVTMPIPLNDAQAEPVEFRDFEHLCEMVSWSLDAETDHVFKPCIQAVSEVRPHRSLITDSPIPVPSPDREVLRGENLKVTQEIALPGPVSGCIPESRIFLGSNLTDSRPYTAGEIEYFRKCGDDSILQSALRMNAEFDKRTDSKQ